MTHTYTKKEKLKSKTLIRTLFSQGRVVTAFPLRLVYLKTTHADAVLFKTGVSVSKRHFKNASDRNRIKRLIREAYRLNKPISLRDFNESHAFMILHLGKQKPTFALIDKQLKLLFKKFLSDSDSCY